jgi:hypothetical protein
MRCLRLGFALRITRANSFRKQALADCRDGCSPLKMKSLRAIQIDQLMIIMTSMKKGKVSCSRNEMRTSKGSPAGMNRFKEVQQLRAKMQCRKRCSKVSSTCRLQRTHSYDGMTWFRRRRIFLVLSRSLSNSQKNTLCRFCTDVFHNHLKAWCTCLEPIRWR